MCSLERNKNAGNLVVRGMTASGHHPGREKKNCSEEQCAGEAWESTEAQKVNSNTGESKETNIC
jgi:hypothetical protein